MNRLKEAMMNTDKAFEEELEESLKELSEPEKAPDMSSILRSRPVLRTVTKKEPDTYAQQESRVHREGSVSKTVVQELNPKELRYKVGAYRGMTKEEAINKELDTHRRTPSRRAQDLQEATKNSIRSLELAKDELVAEYRVEKTNNTAVFDERSANMREQVAELQRQIGTLHDSIRINEEDKLGNIKRLDDHYKKEIDSIDNIIESQRLMLSNMAKLSSGKEDTGNLIDHSHEETK